MTQVLLDLKDCRKCPNCGSKLTKGYGYALDYFCKAMDNKITSGYVEWGSEMNPIPEWCPYLYKKPEKTKWPGDNPIC